MFWKAITLAIMVAIFAIWGWPMLVGMVGTAAVISLGYKIVTGEWMT